MGVRAPGALGEVGRVVEPQVTHRAHQGGLASGCLLTQHRSNRDLRPRMRVGWYKVAYKKEDSEMKGTKRIKEGTGGRELKVAQMFRIFSVLTRIVRHGEQASKHLAAGLQPIRVKRLLVPHEGKPSTATHTRTMHATVKPL